jgi:hypothetical protein
MRDVRRCCPSVSLTVATPSHRCRKPQPLPQLQVGAEGVIELALLFALVLPAVHHLSGADGGRLEDEMAALQQLRDVPGLAGKCALACGCLALLNPLSMAVGLQLGSVMRVFIDVVRAAVVWAAALAYAGLGLGGGSGGFGEAWNGRFSAVQLAGFACICAGLVLYAREAENTLTGAGARAGAKKDAAPPPSPGRRKGSGVAPAMGAEAAAGARAAAKGAVAVEAEADSKAEQ